MPAGSKRKLASVTRSVSPPAQRRRGLEPAQTSPASESHNYPTAAATIVSTTVKKDCAPLRFFSWNVNGIGALLQKQLSFSASNLCPLRAFLRDHNWPALLCLQEVKINRDDAATQRRVEVAANSGRSGSEPTYIVHFSLPRDRYNATGFGGKVHGVATLVRDGIPSSEVSRPDWDLEGRVLVHTFSNLVVVNGYWVNGTTNPYRDPENGIVTGTRHDHKLFFHRQILALCNETLQKGRDILLLGDMNVAPERIDGHPNLRTSPIQHVFNRDDFNKKFLDIDSRQGLHGIDLFRYFHGNEKKYSYRGRGRPWGESADRVDLIVASPGLVDSEAIIASDICDTPHDRGHSDHVPLWVEVDLTYMQTDRRSLP